MARLPKNVRPTHYELDLSLDLDDLTFQGSVIAHIEVIHETRSIILNSKDLEIVDTKIVRPSGEVTKIPAVECDPDQQTIAILLDEPLTIGYKFQLHHSFRGVILEYGKTPGLQWTSYKTASGELKRAYSTSCEPIGARRIFPCFDEPEFKATLSSTVTINQDLTCVSNMDIAWLLVKASETRVSKQIAFNTTPRMSTYLICFAIGDFEFIESTRQGFPVRVYAVRGAKIQYASNMLEVAIQALDHFESIFGLKYPLPKLDLIALPDAGALENWGCIVFGERFILLDTKTTAAKSWQMAVETLCHKIAHQWFGNLVTMAWWDDLWLNEAFAEWAGFFVVDKMFPEWKYWLHFVAADPDPEAMAFYQGALDLDSTPASHPIYNPNASPNRMGELFDNITYMKGASLLRMLCRYLGTGTFIDGIKDYLKRHVFSNATTSDLWDSLTATSGKDVKRLMHEWTKHVGYPILLVSEDRGSGTITLEQHRYLQSVELTPEEDKNLYHVPLNLKTNDGGDDFLMLTSRRDTYPSDLEFYKLNAEQIGLYRVSYPLSRLEIFGKQVSSGKLSAEDCVGLLSDSYALVSSCLETAARTADLLTFLSSFREEQNFLVWRQIFFIFAKIKQLFLFSSRQTSKALQRFHQHLILPRCSNEDGKILSSDDVPIQNEKALFFSQAISYDPFNTVALELFDEFMASDEKTLNPNIRKYVFQAVAKSEDDDRYKAILALARETQDPELRTDAFVSLGYAESPALIHQALGLMTQERQPFFRLEKWFLLNALQTHRAGAEASWAWLKANWAGFDPVSTVTISRYTASCTNSLSTAAQLHDVEEFALSVDEKYNVAFEDAAKGIRARMNWLERDRQGVEAWLAQHGFSL
ncbi:peptidase family M1-domain-containing protein [Xylariales sp. PMI_506]|nr:peptidase family M1-domain-containing protein [Xylariales sp. PMI_506]